MKTIIGRSIYSDAERQSLRATMSPNGRTFCAAYEKALSVAIAAAPTEWHDTPESAVATALAERMTLGLMHGAASLSAVPQKVCRALGIKPTQTALRAYLHGAPTNSSGR